MTLDPSHLTANAGTSVDPAAAPIPTALEPAAHDAYRAAARWAGVRHRQATHDGARVVAAYHTGYLNGLRDGAEGRASSDDGSRFASGEHEEGDDDTRPASHDVHTAATSVEIESRARAEGYADGLRWREPARRGGLVRLMLFLTGKSARRFAAEDLMRSPRRVRRMIAYDDVVEDVVRDELLRRLGTITDPR